MPASPSAAFARLPVVQSAASRPELGVRKVDAAAVLDLRGRFTSDHTEHFRVGIQELLHGGTKKFVVNLAQVTHMDSSGVGALLAAYNSIQAAEGKCKFVGAPPQVLHTLRRMNLDKVFELFEDERAAVSSF